MRLLRVALVALYWKGRGGATSSALTYIPAMQHWGIDIDLVVFSHRGQLKKSEPPPYIPYADGRFEVPVVRLAYKTAAEYLDSNYDLVHFLTMGETSQKKRPPFLDVLEDISIPWMFTIHAPNDYKRYKFWTEQVNIGDFRGAQFVSGLLQQFSLDKYYEYFDEHNTVVSGPVVMPEQVDVSYEKENLVVQHSRLASIKGPHHTVNMVPYLIDMGLRTKIYGRFEFFSYAEKVEQLDYYDLVEWPGSFEMYQVPEILKPAMFDIDFTHHGHGDGKRPQYTALEAACYGAIPILQDQWCCEEMQPGRNVVAVRKGHEVEDTVDGITALIKDASKRRAMVDANRVFVGQWFNKSEALAEFYRKVS